MSNQITVLVVDDDPLVRMVAVDVLQENSFTALESGNADDALAFLRKRAREVDILFSDIQMPGSMDGAALARQVAESWPWIALVLVLGRPRPPLPSGTCFLAKPYDHAALPAQFRKLMTR